jgi:hypothetical protein
VVDVQHVDVWPVDLYVDICTRLQTFQHFCRRARSLIKSRIEGNIVKLSMLHCKKKVSDIPVPSLATRRPLLLNCHDDGCRTAYCPPA